MSAYTVSRVPHHAKRIHESNIGVMPCTLHALKNAHPHAQPKWTTPSHDRKKAVTTAGNNGNSSSKQRTVNVQKHTTVQGKAKHSMNDRDNTCTHDSIND